MGFSLDGGIFINGEEIYFDNLHIDFNKEHKGDNDSSHEDFSNVDDKVCMNDIGNEDNDALSPILRKEFEDIFQGSDNSFLYNSDLEEDLYFEDGLFIYEIEMDDLIDVYTDMILESDLCPDCIREILEIFALNLTDGREDFDDF